MDDKQMWDAIVRILDEALYISTQDRLILLETAWLVVASTARSDALVFPGGFPAEQASQLKHLERMSLLVREDTADLEAERFFQEGDVEGMRKHFRAKIRQLEDEDEKGGDS